MTAAASATSPLPARRSSPRSFDPFRQLCDEERRRQLDAYLELLVRRDGRLDFDAEVLSRRERIVRGFESNPVESANVDLQDFTRCLHGRAAGVDPRARWLAALARSSEAERYGVVGEIARIRARGARRVAAQELHVLLQESYHTRLLEEACRSCGVHAALPLPACVMRGLIVAMQYLPARIRYVPILTGEILGTIVFAALRDRSVVFADEPEVRQRLEALLDEIHFDETFHVVYCRARLGPVGVRVARALAPWIARVMMRAIPQILDLGVDRQEMLERLLGEVPLPAGSGWSEPEPLERVAGSRRTRTPDLPAATDEISGLRTS